MANGWEFWVDRGGTFTDIVARTPNHSLLTYKLLSENPQQYHDATSHGISVLLGLAGNTNQLIHQNISAIKMGSTLATNSLLERRGEKTVLIINQGLADALRIGYQNRPQLFAKQIILPKPLYEKVIEAKQRLNANGEQLIPLDKSQLIADLNTAYQAGYRSVAIVLMHSYLNSDDEKKIAELAEKMGYSQISLSHQVSATIRLIPRGHTTVIDAYLTPILKKYITQLSNVFNPKQLFFMQSNGGIISANIYSGKDSIFSGPAAGVIGAIKTAESEGIKKIISFDMGGTSTDVAHYAGELERADSIEIAGIPASIPSLLIHTIAAGGGSILKFKQNRYQVGPESAGAYPGPACYRHHGPLTITDANVLLGRIIDKYFPAVFGEEGQQILDQEIVHNQFQQLTNEINSQTDNPITPEQAAAGFLKIAVTNMANAIKEVSIQRGHDIKHYTLCCFGGAGAQHACAVADVLGIKKIYIHPLAGVLSALGIGLADARYLKEQSIEKDLTTEVLTESTAVIERLIQQGQSQLERYVTKNSSLKILKQVKLRYSGSDTAILVAWGKIAEMQQAFLEKHQNEFGFNMPDTELILAAVSVEIILHFTSESLNKKSNKQRPGILSPIEQVKMFSTDKFHQTPLYQRNQLLTGDRILGPAIIIDQYHTIIVEPNWELQVTTQLGLILVAKQISQPIPKIATTVNPILLEIFHNQFISIAKQMGNVLAKTAYSVNIKERQDFSCALFDTQGALVANAPHMPVHLGAMSESVQAVIKQAQNKIQPGDMFMLNDPYHGGSHLPDVTIITPVFLAEYSIPIFYVASRAHQADIGGMTPGSIPAFSKKIEEEGVLINHFKLVSSGTLQIQALKQLLTTAPYPVRNFQQNLADICAQIAANHTGVNELKKLIDIYNLETVQAYMKYIQQNATACVKNIIAKLQNGCFNYHMDNGCRVQVNIAINKNQKEVVIDFTGTSAQQNNNFNAPRAVTIAAILYVFRCLIAEPIPLNHGCLQPIKIKIPEKSLLDPQYPAAVVAGNVETSQCVVDTLFGALQVMAASQGTMNNLTFGNANYQYYETIGGGVGAGPGFDGASAVHSHMTNTLLTDPEILEFNFPVLLKTFMIRPNSGGQGRWCGGNGLIRTLQFLQPLTVAIVSNHRIIPPYGMNGGEPGKVGHNYWYHHHNGKTEELPSTAQVEVKAKDEITIKTPGGGGYGQL